MSFGMIKENQNMVKKKIVLYECRHVIVYYYIFFYIYNCLLLYFIVYIKTDDIYNDIAEHVETRFDTSNYELECNFIARPLLKGKNRKVIILNN